MKCRRPNCPNRSNKHRGYCTKHYAALPKGFVDATQCKTHFQQLRLAGYSVKTVSQLSGLHKDTLRYLGQWTDSNRVVLDTHNKIMRIPLPQGVVNRGAQDVPNVGTKRRIQALMAFGYPLTSLAEELGVTPQNVNYWLRREYVTSETVDKVKVLFNRLQLIPGPSKRAKDAATRKGWAPPFSWDTLTIDLPSSLPDFGGESEFMDTVADFRGMGKGDAYAAEFLGIELDSLRRRVEREIAKVV